MTTQTITTTYGQVSIPAGMEERFNISKHAMERIAERGIAAGDFLAALGAPTHVVQGNDGALWLVDQYTNVTVVVDPATRSVITAYYWDKRYSYVTGRVDNPLLQAYSR